MFFMNESSLIESSMTKSGSPCQCQDMGVLVHWSSRRYGCIGVLGVGVGVQVCVDVRVCAWYRGACACVLDLPLDDIHGASPPLRRRSGRDGWRW